MRIGKRFYLPVFTFLLYNYEKVIYGVTMDYKIFFAANGISYTEGLSQNEFDEIETIYGFSFPCELRSMLSQVIPTSKGFINWRDFSDDNINRIKRLIEEPGICVLDRISDIEWNEEWGAEPATQEQKENVIQKNLSVAPKLVPVFFHRYIPAVEGDRVPIISISGLDMIYYGETLDEYLVREFRKSEAKPICFKNVKKVPFWSYFVEEGY